MKNTVPLDLSDAIALIGRQRQEIEQVLDNGDKIMLELKVAIEKCVEQDKQIAALTDERDGYRNGQIQMQDICSNLQDTIEKYVVERKRIREALQTIAADTEYPCEIMDLEGNDGPCQCTCCRWARIAREALSA